MGSNDTLADVLDLCDHCEIALQYSHRKHWSNLWSIGPALFKIWWPNIYIYSWPERARKVNIFWPDLSRRSKKCAGPVVNVLDWISILKYYCPSNGGYIDVPMSMPNLCCRNLASLFFWHIVFVDNATFRIHMTFLSHKINLCCRIVHSLILRTLYSIILRLSI